MILCVTFMALDSFFFSWNIYRRKYFKILNTVIVKKNGMFICVFLHEEGSDLLRYLWNSRFMQFLGQKNRRTGKRRESMAFVTGSFSRVFFLLPLLIWKWFIINFYLPFSKCDYQYFNFKYSTNLSNTSIKSSFIINFNKLHRKFNSDKFLFNCKIKCIKNCIKITGINFWIPKTNYTLTFANKNNFPPLELATNC